MKYICVVCGAEFFCKYYKKTCSCECRDKLRDNSGNSVSARAKAKATLNERFGVDYAMQSDIVKEKSRISLLEKYGVDNIQKLSEVASRARKSQVDNWWNRVRKLLPYKPVPKVKNPSFRIDDSEMQIYVLTESAATTFLRAYGHRINPRFSRTHLSLGLVQDGMLFQVLRFEKQKDQIVLADFGTRAAYCTPDYYSRLMKYAIEVVGIDEFSCKIPRGEASPELITSLRVELVEYGKYEVYWIIDGKYKKLTMRDDVEKLLQKYDYVTTDYLDSYRYTQK